MFFDEKSFKAYACSCGERSEPGREIWRSDAVFSGKVIDFVRAGKSEGYTTKATIFDVYTTWKGVSSDQVTMWTVGGMCSYGFLEGEEYLVYAYSVGSASDTNSNYRTTVCSSTKLLEYAEADLAFLGQGFPPDQYVKPGKSDASVVFPAIFGLGAAVAGMIAFFTLRRPEN